jgi:(2Fe-2S) ferredoxin
MEEALAITNNEPLQAALFDYDSLNYENRLVVQEAADRIKANMRVAARTVIEMGGQLARVKDVLTPKQFDEWLKAEFQWKERSAQVFMAVWQHFGTAEYDVAKIAPSALYQLSAPSTPPVARKIAQRLVESGERVGVNKAKEIIAEAKQVEAPSLLPEPVKVVEVEVVETPIPAMVGARELVARPVALEADLARFNESYVTLEITLSKCDDQTEREADVILYLQGVGDDCTHKTKAKVPASARPFEFLMPTVTRLLGELQAELQSRQGEVEPESFSREQRALHASLHTYSGADERWAKLIETGATDAELKAAIGREFGMDGGGCAADSGFCRHKGGANPSFCYEDGKWVKWVKGTQLLTMVRDVLKIGKPVYQKEVAGVPITVHADESVTVAHDDHSAIGGTPPRTERTLAEIEEWAKTNNCVSIPNEAAGVKRIYVDGNPYVVVSSGHTSNGDCFVNAYSVLPAVIYGEKKGHAWKEKPGFAQGLRVNCGTAKKPDVWMIAWGQPVKFAYAKPADVSGVCICAHPVGEHGNGEHQDWTGCGVHQCECSEYCAKPRQDVVVKPKRSKSKGAK